MFFLGLLRFYFYGNYFTVECKNKDQYFIEIESYDDIKDLWSYNFFKKCNHENVFFKEYAFLKVCVYFKEFLSEKPEREEYIIENYHDYFPPFYLLKNTKAAMPDYYLVTYKNDVTIQYCVFPFNIGMIKFGVDFKFSKNKLDCKKFPCDCGYMKSKLMGQYPYEIFFNFDFLLKDELVP